MLVLLVFPLLLSRLAERQPPGNPLSLLPVELGQPISVYILHSLIVCDAEVWDLAWLNEHHDLIIF